MFRSYFLNVMFGYVHEVFQTCDLLNKYSLRNNMFELADRLVGIYKTDNCTKSITINPGSFAVCGKAA